MRAVPLKATTPADHRRSRGHQPRPCPQAPGPASVGSVRPPSKRYCNTSWASRCTRRLGPGLQPNAPDRSLDLLPRSPALGSLLNRKKAPTVLVFSFGGIHRPIFSSLTYRQLLSYGGVGLAGLVLLRLPPPYGRRRKPFIHLIILYFLFCIILAV